MKKRLRPFTALLFCFIFFAGAVNYSMPVLAATDTNTARIHFINIKDNNDAILIECNGKWGMVDSGEDGDYPSGEDPKYPWRPGIVTAGGHIDQVINYLDNLGVEKLDFYIGTHPHSDHIGSGDTIIEKYTPDRVYILPYKDSYIKSDSRRWDNLFVYDQLIAAANDVGATLIQGFDKKAEVDPKRPGDTSPLEKGSVNYTPPSEEALSDEEATSPESSQISGVYNSASTAVPSSLDSYDLTPEDQIPDEDAATGGVVGNVEDNDSISDEISEETQEIPDADPNACIGNPLFTLGGGMTIEIMNYEPHELPTDDANDLCLGVKITANNQTAFLSGDISNNHGDEDKLAEQMGDINLVKLGHHGLSGSNSVNYLQKLHPDISVLTGFFDYLQPETVETLFSMDTALYTTTWYDSTVIANLNASGIEMGGPIDIRSKKLFFYANNLNRFLYFKDGRLCMEDDWILYNGEKYFVRNGTICTGWTQIGEDWYYLDTEGHPRAGWIGDYYCDENGKLLPNVRPQGIGWAKDDFGWRYKLPSGEQVLNKWCQIQGKWYHFDSYGYMETGWFKEKDEYYYMDHSGAMQTGWQFINGDWYFFKNSGIMVKGWQQIGTTWYYLNEKGKMCSGWLLLDGKYYYLNSSGAMQTGWLKLGNTWYYLVPSGEMQTGWIKLGNIWYYLNSLGAMQTGWYQVGNTWYYSNSSGAMQTGWLYLANKYYYLNNNGAMQTDWVKLNNIWYYLNSSGVMQTGWTKVNTIWYYLQSSGAMQTGWLSDKGRSYYLNANGAMQTKWAKLNNKWYYFEANGAMQVNRWIISGSKWYYLKNDGTMASNTWIGKYYVDASGVWTKSR